MKIGIVLPNVPAYSETFFNNKIKGLQNHGYTILLLVNSNSDTTKTKNIKVAPDFSRNKIYNLFLSIKCFFQSILFNFSTTKKLFYLNKKDNFSIVDNLKNIISNSHILSQKVDWLHFGFGTMAIGRENVAQAIGAKMAVSFRGFDHYVYPIKHKNCYKKLFSKEVKYHVLSSGMKDSLVLQNVNSDKIIKITPAIDINLFNFKTSN